MSTSDRSSPTPRDGVPTDVAHYGDLRMWGLVDLEALLQTLRTAALPPEPRVLDIGCGRGALLVELAAAWDARVTGVDRSLAALDLARADAAQRACRYPPSWIESAFADVDFRPDAFDLVIHLGGPYRDDDMAATLPLLRRWLEPGGHLLLGDGFWKQPPPATYLEATGISAEALRPIEAARALEAACGFERIREDVATRADWDAFEGAVMKTREQLARAHPASSALRQALERARAFHAAQQQWGRSTMGFRVTLLRASTDAAL